MDIDEKDDLREDQSLTDANGKRRAELLPGNHKFTFRPAL